MHQGEVYQSWTLSVCFLHLANPLLPRSDSHVTFLKPFLMPAGKTGPHPSLPTLFLITIAYRYSAAWSQERGQWSPWKSQGRTSLVVQDTNLPANASDTGSIPGPWRSHMMWATKPVCHSCWAQTLEPVLHGKEKLLQWEAHAPQLESSPYAPQQHWRPSSTKNRWINNFLKESVVIRVGNMLPGS